MEFFCGTSYHMSVQLECDMRPHEEPDLIQVSVSQTSVVLLLPFIAYNGS